MPFDMNIYTFKNPAIRLVRNIFGQNIKRKILSEIEFAMGSQEFFISHCFQEKEIRKLLKIKKKENT